MSSFDYKSVLKPRDFLTVFNPSKEVIQRDFGGNTYVFPAEATVEISGVTHTKHNREGNLEPFYIQAATVVAHFLGEDGRSGHLGPLGVRVLSGDPDTDEQIKAEARQVLKERMYLNDIATRAAHLASVKVAKDGGQPAPSPSRPTLEAYQRIAAYEAANGQFNAPFKCAECAIPFFEAALKDAHDAAHHVGRAQATSSNGEVEALKATVAALTQLVQTVVAQAQAPKKVGRPRKVAEA
jgi:hypothetical protein